MECFKMADLSTADLNFDNLSFRHYDNPESAKRVFEEYRKDLKARGLLDDVVRVVGNNKTCEDLDLALYGLLRDASFRTRGCSPIDYLR